MSAVNRWELVQTAADRWQLMVTAGLRAFVDNRHQPDALPSLALVVTAPLLLRQRGYTPADKAAHKAHREGRAVMPWHLIGRLSEHCACILGDPFHKSRKVLGLPVSRHRPRGIEQKRIVWRRVDVGWWVELACLYGHKPEAATLLAANTWHCDQRSAYAMWSEQREQYLAQWSEQERRDYMARLERWLAGNLPPRPEKPPT